MRDQGKENKCDLETVVSIKEAVNSNEACCNCGLSNPEANLAERLLQTASNLFQFSTQTTRSEVQFPIMLLQFN